MSRIGVFVCWCGSNIAGTVDVEKVREEASKIPGVVSAIDYKYMCSDPGQNSLRNIIKEKNLTGVVLAACSPHMHENTFRKAAVKEGLNPYFVEIANIREQVSWVHDDKERATNKAVDLMKMMVEKVKRDRPIEDVRVPLNKRALVIGAGIAGIQTALDIANGGVEVLLVEKEPSIGGRMIQLDETFPTLDCSSCIMTPKMVEANQHPNIKLYTYSEVEDISGYIGNFKIKIKKKTRSVVEKDCTGCGECWNACPMHKNIKSEFNMNLSERTAIYVPFPQAVPLIPVLDRSVCLHFKKGGKCQKCFDACGPKAINFDLKDEIIEETVGAIVASTGYDLMDTSMYGEYGYGKYKDVISGLQFERLLSASGPTEGVIKRPSDGKTPKTIVFVQCVGSRDPEKGVPYCSKVCCMYTAKHAKLFAHKVHGSQSYVFYIDVRATGKGYEEFVRGTMEQDGAVYLRGRVSKIYEDKGKLIVKGADTLSGNQVEIAADMVVLATGVIPKKGSDKLAQMLGISYDKYGFFTESHPKLRPAESSTAGIFLAGMAQGPRDIPESVVSGSAAASKILGLFSKNEYEVEGTISSVNEATCSACFYCQRVCAYNAIGRKEIKDRSGKLIKVVANVNPGLCTGCGACVNACFSKSIDVKGFMDDQIYAEIKSLAV